MTTKDCVLHFLEKNRGSSVSGTLISKELGISRNAVWKAVNQLKKEGFQIESKPNQGYSLKQSDDLLSVQGIQTYLTVDDDVDLRVYDEVKSTNTLAKKDAIDHSGQTTVIVANSQTEGKGRRGRTFYSPPGSGIYLSVVLNPKQFKFQNLTLITAVAAVSVAQVIEETTGEKPEIKWVNDVLLHGRKICGILTEAVTDLETGGMQWVVVGIGLNVTTPEKGFPADIQQRAGTLFQQNLSEVPRNQLAAGIINRFLANSYSWDDQQIVAAYKKRMPLLGKSVVVNDFSSEPYLVTARDVNEQGQLVVETQGGEIKVLNSEEISIKI